MLNANIIERSRSPYSFPVVLVSKKGEPNNKRFCIDYRKLNNITKKNSFPLPLIDDLLACLGKAKYFTSLDLKSGYWQVKMDENDKEKTAFSCSKGHFQFNVMPFGLSNAPAVFQELMSIVLEGLSDCAAAYLDDLLIFSPTLESHFRHLRIVFDRLKQHGLKLKLKKCNFLKEETNYLGFIIDKNGIKPDPKKVEAIKSLPAPTCVRLVRSFLGLCGYYRRFIPNFSAIAEPIINLTRKHARFIWGPEHQKAFDFLKDSLTIVPLLVYPDPNKKFTLYCDASATCIGACLTQECDIEGTDDLPGTFQTTIEKPIYYLSHKLNKTQCKYSCIERECYAIFWSLKKLHFYLHNAEFVIKTDHKPLKYLLESPMQNRRVQVWALSIMSYRCTIQYISGAQNTCADLLSRHPLNVKSTNEIDTEEDSESDVHDNSYQVNIIDSNQIDPKQFAACTLDIEKDLQKPDMSFNKELDLKDEQSKDAEIVQIRNTLLHGEPTKEISKRYLLVDDLVYFISDPDGDANLRFYVPSQLRALVITQYHDDNGHMGVQKCYDSIRLSYFWPNLFKELYNYVTSCTTCQSRSLQKIKQPLQETDQPPYPMAKLSLDVSGPYNRSLANNVYIVSFVDWYSGWPESFSVPNKEASTIAHLLIDEIFPRFGCPLQIVTDNGTENVNKAMKEVMEYLNIDHVLTSVYRPSSNAKCERFHRVLHDVLSKKVAEHPETWDVYLNQALAAIRFNVSESSRYSPFSLLYARDPILPLQNLFRLRPKYQGEDMHQIALQEQHKAFIQVRKNMRKAKERQAKYHDKNAKAVDYKIGDPVFYKNNQRKGKLDVKWKPYYRIIEKTGPLSYIIKNQLTGSTARVHAEAIRLAKIDWDDVNPTQNTERPLRKARYVVPPESGSDSEVSANSEDDIPLQTLIRHYRKERENSDSEDDIPLMELSKRLRNRDHSDMEEPQNQGIDRGIDDDLETLSNKSVVSDLNEEDSMDIDHVKVKNSSDQKKPSALASFFKYVASKLD